MAIRSPAFYTRAKFSDVSHALVSGLCSKTGLESMHIKRTDPAGSVLNLYFPRPRIGDVPLNQFSTANRLTPFATVTVEGVVP